MSRRFIGCKSMNISYIVVKSVVPHHASTLGSTKMTKRCHERKGSTNLYLISVQWITSAKFAFIVFNKNYMKFFSKMCMMAISQIKDTPNF